MIKKQNHVEIKFVQIILMLHQKVIVLVKDVHLILIKNNVYQLQHVKHTHHNHYVIIKD